MNSGKENIYEVGLDQIQNLQEMDYKDDDIAFHQDIRDLPIIGGTIRIDVYGIVTCVKGKLQVEINTKTYTIASQDILLCRPNTLITNCIISPDFVGSVLFISQRVVVENFSQNVFWERALRLAEFPIIHIDSEEKLMMFRLYGDILKIKIKSDHNKLYQKEIIGSIIKAIIYELLANEDDDTISHGSKTVKQSEVLFKRFINLLVDMPIKPRTVSWYADKLCITPKYLSAVCKQVSGRTALDWIYEYVLVDIRYYLKNSDKSIKEIADLLNFPNISFFGKYCRKHFGMSPTAYRKHLRMP